MTDLRSLKARDVVQACLRRATSMLPVEVQAEAEGFEGAPAAAGFGAAGAADLTAWLERLEVVGRRVGRRGGYWKTLENAAGLMNMPDAERRLHDEYRQALKRLAKGAGCG